MNHSLSGKPIAWAILAHHYQPCLVLGFQKFLNFAHHTTQACPVLWHCQQIQQQVWLVHLFVFDHLQDPAKFLQRGHSQWWGLRRRGVHLNEAKDWFVQNLFLVIFDLSKHSLLAQRFFAKTICLTADTDKQPPKTYHLDYSKKGAYFERAGYVHDSMCVRNLAWALCEWNIWPKLSIWRKPLEDLGQTWVTTCQAPLWVSV